MTNAILLDGKDNVATCTNAAAKGSTIKILGGDEIVCVEDIPIWHKVALKNIAKGEKIFKYGEVIGEATIDIAAGGRVSHKNIFSVPRDYASEMLDDTTKKIAPDINSDAEALKKFLTICGRAGIDATSEDFGKVALASDNDYNAAQIEELLNVCKRAGIEISTPNNSDKVIMASDNDYNAARIEELLNVCKRAGIEISTQNDSGKFIMASDNDYNAAKIEELLNVCKRAGIEIVDGKIFGAADERRNFYGYRRADGRAGIRNHVLILPTCACGSETARIVASQVRGAVNIIFNTGCSDVQANTDMSQKILTGFALNPNVFGVVIIGLGCETVPHKKLREKIQAMTDKPVVSFGIQDEGGTLKTISKAVRAARDLAAEAALQQKELCDISELLMGIECGGSDATSGIASNPAVGKLSDKLIDLGASTIMSESIEWIGGEHVLAKRAATPALHNRIIKICADYEKHLQAAGQDCRAGQPTPGNKDGGLSTIDEKSLGCIRKGGTRPIVEVLNQAERPTKRGAIVMDTAGYDISSVTAMVAAGCNAIIFTTGRGTPTGNAIVPVLKVTANARTFEWMEDNIDADLSGIISGEMTIADAGDLLLSKIHEVCNGRLTKAEAYGFSDIAVDHVCRFV